MGQHVHELLHVAAAALFIVAGASALFEYRNLRERAVLDYGLMCLCAAGYACHVVISHNLPKHGEFWIPWTLAGLVVTFGATFFYLVAIRRFVELKTRLFVAPLAVQLALIAVVLADLLRYALVGRSFILASFARQNVSEHQRQLGEGAYSLLPTAQLVAGLFMLSFVLGVVCVLVRLVRTRSRDLLLLTGLGVTAGIIVNDTLVAMGIFGGVYLIAFSKAFEAVRIHRDIRLRSRERIEQRLRRAEKMEAIGRVAGGLAHDFNNILTAIGGRVELAEEAVGMDHPAASDLRAAKEGVDAGGLLIRQLLDVAHSKQVEPGYVDINQFFSDSSKLLLSLVPRGTRLEVEVAPKLGGIALASGELTQVVMNLIVNACDAMPDGGTIRIRVTLSAGPWRGWVRRRTQPRIVISVIDQGGGIPEDVLEHIFEPLFTTKADRGGNGLGLATVYSIVRRAGGDVEVESELGRGTCFHAFFPRVERGEFQSSLAEDDSRTPKH